MAAKRKKNTISFINSHLISVISISLVLFLLGIILIIAFLGNELPRYVKENITMSVVLSEGLSDAKIREIRAELENQSFVKSTEFISKEQALQEMQRKLNINPEDYYGFNPYSAEIAVRLYSEYVHPDTLPLIEKRIASQASIADVQMLKDLIQAVQNIRRVSLVLTLFFLIFIAISFVLINNTVRLLIYSKRFLIYTMRLVGATSSFIRRPFVWHNLVTGIISSLIAIILLMGSLYYVSVEFINLEEILNFETMILIYGIVFISGIMLSIIAAFFAVNRYLRMSHRKLYYI